MHKWEVKKGGATKCYGDCMQSLPSDDMLANLRAAGYKVYIDGQLAKVSGKVKRCNI